LPDKVEITTKSELMNGTARPDLIARTKGDIIYDGPTPALFDYDSKGMPAAVADEIERTGGFLRALAKVLPAFKAAALVARRSTSAGLYRTDTGQKFPQSDGWHVYVLAKDGKDIERFLDDLQARCWLAGFGWGRVSKAGRFLVRSIIDASVGGPEHLAFEGGPVLIAPVGQDKASRQPVAADGGMIDTAAACPPFTAAEQAQFKELIAQERQRLAPEMERARKAYVARKAKELTERNPSLSPGAARKIIERQCDGVLRPDAVLPFDNPELAGRTAGDVLDDPARFEGEKLADPLDDEDRPGRAMVMVRGEDGTPFIHSWAHGRVIYDLKHDFASIRKAMETAANKPGIDLKEIVGIFARLAAGADLDPVELEELRQRGKELSGIGLRVINDTLKAAKQQQADLGPRPGELPELLIDRGDLTKTAKQLAERIAEHRRFLFNGHEPVQVITEAGMPYAIAVTPDAVRVFAHEICTPKQRRASDGKIVRITLSGDIAGLYLNGLQGRWGLRPFNGITTAPILNDDGSFRINIGYDEATGLWCHNIPEVNVPEKPTKTQAEASLGALRHFFRTFAFADAAMVHDQDLGVDIVDPKAPIGLDESSFLVSLMTSVCRASLILAPGILASAPAISGAGTGKGLITRAVCIVASGAPPSAFTAGHDKEELDKRLTAALIEARPAIFLDNYNSKDLVSDTLASALTESPCEVPSIRADYHGEAAHPYSRHHNRHRHPDRRRHGAAAYQDRVRRQAR
jgi:hypothetical protein